MRYKGLIRQLFHWFLWWVLLPMSAIFMLLSSCNMRELSRSRAIHRLETEAQEVREELLADQQRAELSTAVDYGKFCRRNAAKFDARIIVMNLDGFVLGDSEFGAYQLDEPQLRAEVNAAMEGESQSVQEEDSAQDKEFLRSAIPLRHGGRIIGVIAMIKPWYGWRGLLREIGANSALPILILCLLVVAAVIWSSSQIGELVTDLSAKTTRIAGGSGKDEVHTDDPFLQLTTDLNALDRQVTRQISRLEQEKRQWEELFTNMREGFLAVDAQLQLITMNRAACHFLNLAENEDVPDGQALAAVVRNADLIAFLNALLEGEKPFREGEMEIKLANGDACHLRMSGVRFRDDENNGGALVVLHDITQIKRLEDMRREFVANVSHELKTPLTAIKGFLEPLEDCVAANTEQAKRFVKVINRHATRMNAIIDDLLTISKLEQLGAAAGGKDFETRDLADCVRQAANLCRDKARQNGIEIEVDAKSKPLHANHRLLEQAVLNLLDNAVKYSPGGSKVEVYLEEAKDTIKIMVRDQGEGIAEEHLERIFERFYRVDKSRDRKTGGTGLGLSIVKHIAMLHGGKVTVMSEPGEGSTFTIWLPKPSE